MLGLNESIHQNSKGHWNRGGNNDALHHSRFTFRSLQPLLLDVCFRNDASYLVLEGLAIRGVGNFLNFDCGCTRRESC